MKSFAKTTQDVSIESLKDTKFSLTADGSNTTTSKKFYTFVVIYSDEQLKKKKYMCIIIQA